MTTRTTRRAILAGAAALPIAALARVAPTWREDQWHRGRVHEQDRTRALHLVVIGGCTHDRSQTGARSNARITRLLPGLWGPAPPRRA